MLLGVCSCENGKDGSPCKHQYLLWVSGKANGINFVPVTSPELQQKLAWVALGASLPIKHYTTLRCNVHDCELTSPPQETTNTHTPEIVEDSLQLQLNSIPQIEAEDDAEFSHQGTISTAVDCLQQSCNILIAKLESCQDQALATGIIKFSERLNLLTRSMQGNLTSALFTFGANQLRKGNNGKKIKVQPNRKRKSGNCSRQAVAKGRTATLKALELPAKKAKRSHNLALSVKQNTNVAKKSGSHVMHSKTTHFSK
jgi:hypothetical protein